MTTWRCFCSLAMSSSSLPHFLWLLSGLWSTMWQRFGLMPLRWLTSSRDLLLSQLLILGPGRSVKIINVQKYYKLKCTINQKFYQLKLDQEKTWSHIDNVTVLAGCFWVRCHGCQDNKVPSILIWTVKFVHTRCFHTLHYIWWCHWFGRSPLNW